MSGTVSPAAPPRAEPRAWVVFCGDADLWWLRLLRPGFRHCFVALNDGTHWITMDPLSPHLEIAVQPVAGIAAASTIVPAATSFVIRSGSYSTARPVDPSTHRLSAAVT